MSYGLEDLRLLTRTGIQVLLGQAAGIVLALLSRLLARRAARRRGRCSPRARSADVQRRLPAIGVQRALGFTPRPDRRPAGDGGGARRGARRGARARRGRARGGGAGAPTCSRRSTSSRPGGALVLPLAGCLAGIVAARLRGGDVARVARRPAPAGRILRGGDARAPRALGGRAAAAGCVALGARFALARRGALGARPWRPSPRARGVVLLHARARVAARARCATTPATVGKRYQLTARLDPSTVPTRSSASPAWTPRRRATRCDASDAFRLGEPLRARRLPGRPHGASRRRRSPRAARPRRRARPRSASGSPTRSGCGPARRWPSQLPTGARAALHGRRASCARSSDEGRRRVRAPGPAARGRPGAHAVARGPAAPGCRPRAGGRRALRALGAPPQAVGGATTRNAAFLGVLAAVLRVVGLAVGLVCLYALVQALARDDARAPRRGGAAARVRRGRGERRAPARRARRWPSRCRPPCSRSCSSGSCLGAARGVARGGLRRAAARRRARPGAARRRRARRAGGARRALVARRARREPIIAGLREE